MRVMCINTTGWFKEGKTPFEGPKYGDVDDVIQTNCYLDGALYILERFGLDKQFWSAEFIPIEPGEQLSIEEEEMQLADFPGSKELERALQSFNK